MTKEQQQLIEMVPGDESWVNGHRVAKIGMFWIVDKTQSTADLPRAAQLCGEVRCTCENPDRPGHPTAGYCGAAIGGKRL